METNNVKSQQLVAQYLADGSSDAFFEIFTGAYKYIMWVDWGEEDDAIIEYCEKIIQTGELSAELNSADDPIGFEVIIIYKGERHKIHYKGKGSDRDTTLITLNEVLQPVYDIRFCKSSDGSDTLAFMPLTHQQWAELESQFGSKVGEHFSKIDKDTVLFG